MSKFAYDICAYTGMGTEPEWIILNEAYVQSDRSPNPKIPQNLRIRVAKIPQKVLQDLKETGEDIRRSEKHAEDDAQHST